MSHDQTNQHMAREGRTRPLKSMEDVWGGGEEGGERDLQASNHHGGYYQSRGIFGLQLPQIQPCSNVQRSDGVAGIQSPSLNVPLG